MNRTLSRRKVWIDKSDGNPRIVWRVIWNIREACWLPSREPATIGTIILSGMEQNVVARGKWWFALV